ncbi:type 4a pilus biogenesis protein PilO [Candidatus Daviesbacteria bacterium]|nr:type 4a pilus biogenesis protein PilO [Candidatus Daviesbacteria bacterium]
MATEPKYSRYYTFIKPVVENKLVRSFAPLIFSLITIAILAVFAIRPTVATILSLQKEINQDSLVLNQLQTKGKNLELGQKNYDALSQNTRQKIENYLPSQTGLTQLMQNLATTLPQTASASAIQIQPLTLSSTPAPGSKPSLGEVNFSYSVNGDFTQLQNILQQLTRLPRLASIVGVVFNKQGDAPTNMTVNAKAFFIK